MLIEPIYDDPASLVDEEISHVRFTKPERPSRGQKSQSTRAQNAAGLLRSKSMDTRPNIRAGGSPFQELHNNQRAGSIDNLTGEMMGEIVTTQHSVRDLVAQLESSVKAQSVNPYVRKWGCDLISPEPRRRNVTARYKKQDLPNPEFMTKLAKEGYRGPESIHSSQGNISRTETPLELDVDLSNYIADIGDIIPNEQGGRGEADGRDSAGKVVMWPPVSDSRVVTPEILTPPPSYAQLEKHNNSLRDHSSKQSFQQELQLNQQHQHQHQHQHQQQHQQQLVSQQQQQQKQQQQSSFSSSIQKSSSFTQSSSFSQTKSFSSESSSKQLQSGSSNFNSINNSNSSQINSSQAAIQNSSQMNSSQAAIQNSSQMNSSQAAIQNSSSSGSGSKESSAKINISATASPVLRSPVNKRQKTATSPKAHKYERDSLMRLDAEITDIQRQFEAELDSLIMIADDAAKQSVSKAESRPSRKEVVMSDDEGSYQACDIIYNNNSNVTNDNNISRNNITTTDGSFKSRRQETQKTSVSSMMSSNSSNSYMEAANNQFQGFSEELGAAPPRPPLPDAIANPPPRPPLPRLEEEREDDIFRKPANKGLIMMAAQDLHEEVCNWSSKDNDIIAAAKKMALLMAKLSQLVQEEGTSKKELIGVAVSIVQIADEVTALATTLAHHCMDKRMKTNLMNACERIPTIATQLKILTTVKATMLGSQTANEDCEATEMLVGNAQNLMGSVKATVMAAEAASIKIRTDAGIKFHWVRQQPWYQY